MITGYIHNCSTTVANLFNKTASRASNLYSQALKQEIQHPATDADDCEIQSLLADDTVDPKLKEYVRALMKARRRGNVVTLSQDIEGSSHFQIHERSSPLSSATNSRITFASQSNISAQASISALESSQTWSHVDVSFPSTRSLGIRILSCDGGGVRGLSELVILTELQKKMVELGCPNVPPCVIFDFIIGTSTGGIIAILLGRCGFTVEKCIEIYRTFSRDIFKSITPSKLARFLASNNRLPSDVLTAKMEEVIEECFGDKDTSLASGKDSSCKVAVVAARFDAMDSGEAVIIRSYESESAGPASTATIVQAARATSAAPTYFSPMVVNGVRCIDGGIGTNNPAIVALREAHSLWPDKEIAAFVSIGTGSAAGIPAKDLNRASVSLTTSSHPTHERIVKNKFIDPDQYFRFNVPELGSAVALDKWEKLDEIEKRTEAYLRTPEMEVEIERCAKALGL